MKTWHLSCVVWVLFMEREKHWSPLLSTADSPAFFLFPWFLLMAIFRVGDPVKRRGGISSLLWSKKLKLIPLPKSSLSNFFEDCKLKIECTKESADLSNTVHVSHMKTRQWSVCTVSEPNVCGFSKVTFLSASYRPIKERWNLWEDKQRCCSLIPIGGRDPGMEEFHYT